MAHNIKYIALGAIENELLAFCLLMLQSPGKQALLVYKNAGCATEPSHFYENTLRFLWERLIEAFLMSTYNNDFMEK